MIRLLYLSLLLPLQLFCKNVPDSLQTVDLQHKNLTKLPDDFSYSSIRELLIGYNAIKNLPGNFADAKNLTKLNIDHNPQFDFEAGMYTISQLKLESLSINSSNLLYLPLELGNMKALRDVSLASNYIKEIPGYVFLHADFHSLNLSGNLIKDLPKEMASQQNLAMLDLSHNPCINTDATYKALYELKNLAALRVKGASALPEKLWRLKSLQELTISDGTFSSLVLPKDAHKHTITRFSAEHCNNLDFEALMPFLSSSSLKDIAIGGGKFNGFSNADISSNVLRLTLSGTQLNHFSFSTSLSNLEELRLDFGSITCHNELLSTIGKLSNLKYLDLSNGGFTELPAQISGLKKLETLNVSGNTFSSIAELSSLKHLETLDVSMCGLTDEQVEELRKNLPNTTVICYRQNGKLPLANARVNSEKFSVDPANPQVITTQNGTTITIPKNSLVYDNGKAVKEPVTINYTPYYSLADISVAGINMNYKTSDTEAPFSSAGMFNINANANGKTVELKKGAEMTVAFKSNDGEQSYNYYLYDTVKRSWTQTGKDTITKIKVATVEPDTVENPTLPLANAVPEAMPQPPMFYKYHAITITWDLEKNGRMNGEFTLDTYFPRSKAANDTSANENYFNELRPLKGLRWKIDADKAPAAIKAFMKDKNLAYSEAEKRNYKRKPRYYLSRTRVDKAIEFDLVADKEHDNFIFKFYDDVDTVSFNAYPIVNTRNAEREQKTVKKMYFKYKGMAEKRKEITEYKRQRFANAYKAFKINLSAIRGRMTEKNKREIAGLLNSTINTNAYGITRVLSLQGFGVYNCDRPVYIENPIVISPVFYDEKGQKLEGVGYQMIDPKENIVVSYYGRNSIRVSKNSIITFINNTYSSSKTIVSIGKLNTFDLQPGNGKTEVALTPVPDTVTLGQLNEMINASH